MSTSSAAAPGARRPIVVAIPVRDEAERIGSCLHGLASQRPVLPDAVVLLLNNCTDGTAGVVRTLASELPFAVVCREVLLPPPYANAGTARSRALELAADIAGPQGRLVTTDADGVAPPDWLARIQAAFAAGADAVMGRAVIDPVEARRIPESLHVADALECAYAALLDHIHASVDPDPGDPWPRHTEESGASLAVTVAAWREVGGMLPAPLGEDRAFADRLRRHDRRVRHDPAVWVTVSGRIVGRAAGGMADTIRRRLTCPDAYLDDRLEPALDAWRRVRLRVALRSAWRQRRPAARLARALGLDTRQLAGLLRPGHFGAAWAAVEAASSTLARRRVPSARVEMETEVAAAVLARLGEGLRPASLSVDAAVAGADTRAVAAE